MVILPEYRRRPDETETMYKFRICECKDKLGGWQVVADILNSELGLNYSESAYRKPHCYYKSIQGEFAKSELEKEGLITQLDKAKIDLQVERQKLSDISSRYKAYIREQARWELMVEEIVKAIREDIRLSDPVKPLQKLSAKERVAVATIADCHDGAEFDIKGVFGESLNKYSPEIFEARMWRYAEEILRIANKEKLFNWQIWDLGDGIEGILRLSSLNFIRWGVADSAIHYAKFLVKWLRYLSKYIYIDFVEIGGNHDDARLLTGQKGDFPNENVMKLVNEIIKASLEENPNVTVCKTNNKFFFTRILDEYNVLVTHGEEKGQAQALKDYETLYGVTINYLFGAHKHFNYTEEVGFDKMVFRVRSIVGVNDFAVSILKSANPGGNVFIFEAGGRGVAQQYNINLSDPE